MLTCVSYLFSHLQQNDENKNLTSLLLKEKKKNEKERGEHESKIKILKPENMQVIKKFSP